MYIGILKTDYEIYAVGETENDVKKSLVKGYKDFYPIGERRFEKPTFDELNEWFGCRIYKVNSKGHAHE